MNRQVAYITILLLSGIFGSTAGLAEKGESKEKIVLISGIDFFRMAQCGFKDCPDDEYLLSDLGSILHSEFSKHGTYADIHSFKWSRDMVTHGENLKTKFSDWFYNEVCSEGVECYVSFIAHSWGTIIATDFIASMSESSTIKIRTVVTYGSPATGAQIKSSEEAFWQIAIRKVTDSFNEIDSVSSRWINIVNPNDPVAWDYLDNNGSDISGVENVMPDGSRSAKGRLKEAFPVSNSEFDPQYLGTSFARLYIDRGQEAFNFILSSWGVNSPPNLEAHGTSNYQPERLVKYVTDRIPTINHSEFSGTWIIPGILSETYRHSYEWCDIDNPNMNKTYTDTYYEILSFSRIGELISGASQITYETVGCCGPVTDKLTVDGRVLSEDSVELTFTYIDSQGCYCGDYPNPNGCWLTWSEVSEGNSFTGTFTLTGDGNHLVEQEGSCVDEHHDDGCFGAWIYTRLH